MTDFPSIADPNVPLRERSRLPTLRSPFEAGYVQTRPKWTESRRVFELSWNAMTKDDMDTLRAFYEDTVRGGADSFTWEHPITAVNYIVRIVGDEFSSNLVSPGRYGVRLVLEEVGFSDVWPLSGNFIFNASVHDNGDASSLTCPTSGEVLVANGLTRVTNANNYYVYQSDGVNDFLEHAGTESYFDIGTKSAFMAIWATVSGGPFSVFKKDATGAPWNYWVISAGAGASYTMRAYLAQSGVGITDVYGVTNLNDGNFHFLVCVIDQVNNVVDFYVDGELDKSNSGLAPTSLDSTEKLRVFDVAPNGDQIGHVLFGLVDGAIPDTMATAVKAWYNSTKARYI